MNYRFNDTVNVRSGPSTQTRSVAQYYPGETVRIDQISFGSDGKTWGSYIGGSGQRRYVCLKNNGERYASPY